jgi:hypothetical protein
VVVQGELLVLMVVLEPHLLFLVLLRPMLVAGAEVLMQTIPQERVVLAAAAMVV